MSFGKELLNYMPRQKPKTGRPRADLKRFNSIFVENHLDEFFLRI
jgi:hypothetical protein